MSMHCASPGLRVLIVVCTIMVLAAGAIFLLHDSEQPAGPAPEGKSIIDPSWAARSPQKALPKDP